MSGDLTRKFKKTLDDVNHRPTLEGKLKTLEQILKNDIFPEFDKKKNYSCIHHFLYPNFLFAIYNLTDRSEQTYKSIFEDADKHFKSLERKQQKIVKDFPENKPAIYFIIRTVNKVQNSQLTLLNLLKTADRLNKQKQLYGLNYFITVLPVHNNLNIELAKSYYDSTGLEIKIMSLEESISAANEFFRTH